MRQTILAVMILLLSGTSFAQEENLELIETKYSWFGSGEAPSCGLLKARSKQRKKIIREFEHYSNSLPESYDDFFNDSYLLNRLFLDFRVWQDETIRVSHHWRVPNATKETLFAVREKTHFWLESDGINWLATSAMFPEEVDFEFYPESGEVITHHETYYVDYCQPRNQPRLTWYSDPNIDLVSTSQRVEQFKKLLQGAL